MERTFTRLRAQMQELGLSLSIWDASGQLVGEFKPAWELCRLMDAAESCCRRKAGELALKVMSESKPRIDQGSRGCGMIGVPVFQRRRLAGAVVASYPSRSMASGEELSSLAERLGISNENVAVLANEACRHGPNEAQTFLRVLTWMLEREQGADVAGAEIATLSANLTTTYEELSLMYRISGAMKVTQRPADFLQDVCNELLEVMNIEAAVAVAYAHLPASQDDEAVIAGDIDLNMDQLKLLAAAEIAPRLVEHQRAILDNNFQPPAASGLGRSIRGLVAAPLVADKTPIGMLIGINKKSGDFDSIDLKLINSVANQAAVFVANNRLYSDMQDLLMGVLHALTATIDAKDEYTCGHSQRVAMISRQLAQANGFDAQKVQLIYLSGLLHDIGKIGVPEAVLCKPGRLTDEEFESIKRHPALGAKILGGIRQLDDVVVGILTHHERLDGGGYPQGLKGSEVPIEGRIVGLADSFDAMTTSRTYRKALPLQAVIEEIRRHSGTQFDPIMVDSLLKMDLEKYLDELRLPSSTVFPVNLANVTTRIESGARNMEPAGAARAAAIVPPGHRPRNTDSLPSIAGTTGEASHEYHG